MKIQSFAVVALISLFSCLPTHGMFIPPKDVPVDRLLNTAEKYLNDHKDSAEAHFLLARIHYLAFVHESSNVPSFPDENDGKPHIPPDWMDDFLQMDALYRQAAKLALKDIGAPDDAVPNNKRDAYDKAYRIRVDELIKTKWRPPSDLFTLSEKDMIIHVTAALSEFRTAIKLEPKNSLYALGLASLIEQVTDWKIRRKPDKLPADLVELDYAKAKDAYLNAYRLAYPKDSNAKLLGVAGLRGMASFEAGQAYIHLAESTANAAKPTTMETAALAEVKAGMDKITKIPQGVITPIIFKMQPTRGIGDLLAPGKIVDFDLRGYGPSEHWPWVQPDTALLVWDPNRLAEITSGRQLFGGYTFQLFRANGYDALAGLDDNGDEVLSGDELAGIRAWFDRNGDGRSSPDEVLDLTELGIVAIATHATETEGPHPTNPRGLILRDCSVLPTWDWMVEPVQ